MINWSNWVNLGRNYTFRMAKKDRTGNRKTREQRTQFNVPELGKPFSASLLNNISRIGSNYEKSKHFYVDLLGFSIVRENYRPERDDYKIDLQLDEMELELFIIKNCPKRPSYPEAYGLRHLAFAVDSVDNAVKEVTDSATGAVSGWFLPF